MCPQVIFKADNIFRFQQEINPFIIVVMVLRCLMVPNPTSHLPQEIRSQMYTYFLSPYTLSPVHLALHMCSVVFN